MPGLYAVPMNSARIIKARDLQIDNIVIDEDGEYEVTNIDCPIGDTHMGVTMHGYEDGGEFVYRQDQDLKVYGYRS